MTDQCSHHPRDGARTIAGPLFSDDPNTAAKLDEAAALLAAIVATSSDAIISKTLTGIVTSWNESAERLFGYSAREMIGQSIRRVIPEERQAEEDNILAKIGAGQVVTCFETVRRGKDGRLIEVSITASPVLNAAGQIVGASKIVRDISERKRAEERAELLMYEINHRAKNMLSVVMAIARATTAGSVEEFVQRFFERIRALEAIQDLLVKNQWRSIDLDDLVRSQLAHLVDLIGTRLVFEGPAMRISSQAGQAIGMALFELATNAGKYGSLSSPFGCVRISWGREGERFVMTWQESDGPAVSQKARRGFGRRVIEDMTRLTLAAEVTLRYAPEGVFWRLDCPWPNVAA